MPSMILRGRPFFHRLAETSSRQNAWYRPLVWRTIDLLDFSDGVRLVLADDMGNIGVPARPRRPRRR